MFAQYHYIKNSADGSFIKNITRVNGKVRMETSQHLYDAEIYNNVGELGYNVGRLMLAGYEVEAHHLETNLQ